MTMKSYAEILKGYIAESGLTLEQLAEEVNKKGIKIHPTYISKLRLGKRPAPSEEITKALAEITGGDPEELIKAGHFEKMPEDMKESFHKANILSKFVQYMKKEKPIEGGSGEDYNSLEFLQTLSDKALDEFLSDLTGGFVSEAVSKYEPNKMTRVPLLGSIRAGHPMDRIEYHEGYTLVDPDVLRGREGFALKVKGDSMIGDRIQDGDTVIVVVQEEVNPSDIAVVAVNGDFATLKRVKCQGDICMLIPSNPKMDPQLVPAKDVHVIGKVVEVKISLD